jgi:hypothetical protein
MINMIWKILLNKNVLVAVAVMATLLGLYTLLNTTLIKPRVAKDVAEAMIPIEEGLTKEKENVRLAGLIIAGLEADVDSLSISSNLYYATQNRLQKQIHALGKQNRELIKGFRIDAVVIRQKRNGSVIDSVYIENYRKY